MVRIRTGVLALILAVAGGAAALPAARAWWRWNESNPVRRGAALAARLGCHACHGPGGTGGLPDPGLGEEVPSWDGGVPMMYVSGPDEVREYILDGVSGRRAASASARAERERAAIHMPAYRDLLDDRQVDDLVAYFMAASRTRSLPDPAVSRGRGLVARYHCEACHGVVGAGGIPNPGSLTGYVPGWLGSEFAELVRDDEELRDWLLDGGIERLGNNRIARFFLTRQRLQMPAYRDALGSEEVDDLIAYIRWLRESKPQVGRSR